ncbi:MAG: aldo/keto reductase [Actinobacteria bacterium]|nr:MAG: aldo/keto reductase [Actinomycetota bacterium]
MPALEHRPLGTSGIEVSALALGSWRTYERMSRGDGLAVMRAAREAGIDFLDDARYDDETGEAPIPTGYSEVVFGELFRASGWKREEVVISNKLWWEFWPEQSAAGEIDASLGRMGLDHLDLIYSEKRPEGLSVAEVVESATGLIAAGKARVWGVLNWPADEIAEAGHVALAEGVPAPCAAQLAYNLVWRSTVEDEAVVAALDSSGASVVASAVLGFGALTGRGRTGRAAETPDTADWQRMFEVGERLRFLAAELDTSPVRLAIAFALSNPHVAAVLFGASRPEQVVENVGALELLERLGEDELAEVRALAA